MSRRLTITPRPITRADCSSVPRPCPYVSCRHNLSIEQVPSILGIRSSQVQGLDDDTIVDAMLKVDPERSCVLDVIDDATPDESEGYSGAQIADVFGVTHQYISTIEKTIERKIKKLCAGQTEVCEEK